MLRVPAPARATAGARRAAPRSIVDKPRPIADTERDAIDTIAYILGLDSLGSDKAIVDAVNAIHADVAELRLLARATRLDRDATRRALDEEIVKRKQAEVESAEARQLRIETGRDLDDLRAKHQSVLDALATIGARVRANGGRDG